MRYLLILLGFFAFLQTASAQYPPRIDDHFHRRKILYRLDLQEKLNKPIIKAESDLYLPEEGKYRNKKGMISALLSGFERGEYQGYDPDSLENKMTYEQLITKLKNYESGGESAAVSSESASSESEGEFGEEEEDSWDSDAGEDDQAGEDVLPSKNKNEGPERSLVQPLEQVVDLVEDRIFDKNKSDVYYDIQWIKLSFIDPQGKMLEKGMVMFKYKDVMDVLNNSQWKNRFNDAEYRTLQEIIEMRLFNSFFLEVSGNEVNDVEEAERRRIQLVHFEHHLWNY